MDDIFVGYALLQKATKPKLWPGHEPEDYYFFSLNSFNNKVIMQSEQYTQKHNATEIIEKYFPQFKLEDETGEGD